MISTIFTDNLVLRLDERVLVVSDEPMHDIAQTLLSAAKNSGVGAEILELPTVQEAGLAPEGFTANVFEGYSAALLATSRSLSHTAARRSACRDMGLRIASMPGITPEIIRRLFRPGYAEKIAAINRFVAKKIGDMQPGSVQIKSPKGTDLFLSITGRKLYTDSGIYDSPGRFGNLPAGEIAWAPVAETASGRVVFDVAFAGVGSVNKLTMTLDRGRVIDVVGDEAAKVWRLLSGDTERILGEFGIGTNPYAIPGPVTLEAEKAVGTVHLGFGDNRSFGGTNVAAGHWDGVMLIDEVLFDGKAIDIARMIESFRS